MARQGPAHASMIQQIFWVLLYVPAAFAQSPLPDSVLEYYGVAPADAASCSEVDAQVNKEYLKKVADRTNALKAANLRASAFNRFYAEWVYVVPESVINGIRPDLDFASLSPSNPASSIGDLLKVKPTTPQK